MVGRATALALAAAAARFLRLLPALLLGWLWLRAAEIIAALTPGAPAGATLRLAVRSLSDDAYALARHLPLLFLCSLPALLSRSPRTMRAWLGASWSSLLLLQAALIQYAAIAHVPLGADLFAYSWRDIGQTVGAGLQLAPAIIAGTVFALATLWVALAWLMRRAPGRAPGTARAYAASGLLVVSLALLPFTPAGLAQRNGETVDAYDLRLNKMAFFIDDSLRLALQRVAPPSAQTRTAAAAAAATAAARAGSAYPFLHVEQTPDELGPHFRLHAAKPPNLVFIIVEGLGRSFSGPGAPLGSFTPFLDELAAQGLYWENFLAVQGRTFAALPSIFGSLPFGANGFDALTGKLPEHTSLLGVLKANGYRLNFYAGTNLDFDGERAFLEAEGVDTLVDATNFPAGYARSNDWGYADGELVAAALAAEPRDEVQPFVTVLQTNSTHSPYTFRGQAAWRGRFERRLDEIGVAAGDKAGYRARREIYTTVLYLDDALRRYFAAARERNAYGNTIYIVTGDHRLPELPMDEWIDRYHVPLIISSPLLIAPERIKSISSDFDLAPSLLALLAHGSGIRTPRNVAWIGTGLDLEPAFRNLHRFPLKQTKTDLVDYIDGPWMQSRGRLYALSDGLHMDPAQDAAAQARVAAHFDAFVAANEQFARTRRLAPDGSFAALEDYGARAARARPPGGGPAASLQGIVVGAVDLPSRATGKMFPVVAVFTNEATQRSQRFVPLAVLLAPDGRELSEAYGQPLQLGAGESATVRLLVRRAGAGAGRNFLNVIPSHPVSGKRIGTGRYHVPVVIGG
ncbi:MAG: LTA synthase family protein [Gammaproteobacteria bacterium]|nr:LTA synthase family protein [Gammaproteobacteria bacterium]